MGTSVLHIKTEVECRVYLFDEEKGIAKPGTYFNLEVRKGEQDLLFVSTEDETLRFQPLYIVEESDSDYRLTLERLQFRQYSKELLEDIRFAKQGDSEAQFRLGDRYYNGGGIEQNYEEAVWWWNKAAEQGDADAQNNLGICYSNGEGVVQDYKEAVKWFRMAAEHGQADAQFNLGRCYENGEGVKQDFKEAEKWFHKALEQSDDTAYENNWPKDW